MPAGINDGQPASQIVTSDPALLRNRPTNENWRLTTPPAPAPRAGWLRRVAQAVQYTISGVTPSTWFSPLQPLRPFAPESARSRQFDFPVGWNLNYIPRSHEPVSFGRLRAVAQNCVILRECIQTRIDQMTALDWHIVPLGSPAERPALKKKYADDIRLLTKFFESPDKRLDWSQWLSGVLDQHFVYDAVALYKRRNRGGQLYALEQLDAASISVLIDENGRPPKPPNPAFQQVLKGIPAADYATYTAGDLIYGIKNWRPDHAYGYGPCEQVLAYAEMAIARLREQMAFYTHGDVPVGIMEAPVGFSNAQITEIQQYWDSVFLGNIEQRRRLWWVPAGTKYEPFTKDVLTDAFDEWLARVICYAMSIAPGPFIKEQNRATAQVNQAQASAEGLQPTSQWMRRFVNGIIRDCFGIDYLGIAWDGDREFDPIKQSVILSTAATKGAIALDDWRESIGQDPLGGAFSKPMVLTAAGYVPVDPDERAALTPCPGGPIPANDVHAPPGGKLPKPPRPGRDDAVEPVQPGTRPSGATRKMAGSEVISVERPLYSVYELSEWADRYGIGLVERPAVTVAMIVTAGLLSWPVDLMLSPEMAPMILVEPGQIKVEADATGVWLALESDELRREMAAFDGWLGDTPRMLVSLDVPDDVPPNFPGMLLFGSPEYGDDDSGLAKVTHAEVEEAAAETARDPTEAQRASGNYKKGHIEIQGLPIAIENAQGSIRESRHDGWRAVMPTEYGYIEDTKDADGEPVDVFLGPDPESATVFIIDQVKEDGSFDEHKTFIGYHHWSEAQHDFIAAYRNADTRGPAHPGHHFIGSVHEWTMARFKEWLKSGKTTTPISPDAMRKMEAAEGGPVPFIATTGSGTDPLSKAAAHRLPPVRQPRDAEVQAIADKVHRVLTALRNEVLNEIGDQLGKDAASAGARANTATSQISLDALKKLIEIEPDLGRIAVQAGKAAAEAAVEAVAPEQHDDSAVFDAVDEKALDHARRRAAEMVGMRYDEDGNLVPAKRAAMRIDDTTREMLRGTLAQAYEDGLSAAQTRDLLSEDYAFSLARSLTIARTEAADASMAGAMTGYREAAKEYGAKMKKSWLVGDDPCEICQANADQGEIDMDDTFQSGDDAPPAHPNDRCDIAVTIVEDGGDQGSESEE